MSCLICSQAETVERFTSIKFERGEFQLVVNDVPARVCPSCGEAYIEEEVTVQLLQRVERIYDAGMLEDAIDYKRSDAK